MKIQPTVRNETIRIAIGTIILSMVMLLVFALLKQFDYTVVLGAILGTCAAVLNFFLLGLSVQKAAESMNGVEMPPEPEEEEGTEKKEKRDIAAEVPEIKQAKRNMQASYTMRMVLLAVFAIVGVVAPCFHSVAALVPLLFPQIVIAVFQLKQRKEV